MKKYTFSILIILCLSAVILPGGFQAGAGKTIAMASSQNQVTLEGSVYLPMIMAPYVRVGQQISIHIPAHTFPENTPFHFAHGWLLGPPIEHQDLFSFTLKMDNVDQTLEFIDASTDPVTGVLSLMYVYNFRHGQTGTHTFTGTWFAPCFAVSDSCADPLAIVQTEQKETVVTFVP